LTANAGSFGTVLFGAGTSVSGQLVVGTVGSTTFGEVPPLVAA